MKKAAALILSIAVVAGAVNLLSVRFGEILYSADVTMQGDGFWKDHTSVTATPGHPLIPMQVPGPLDAWAGSEGKAITIRTPAWDGAVITIRFLDSHEASPPTIRVTAGGIEIGRFTVTAGSGKSFDFWHKEGTPSEFTLTVPREAAADDGTDVTISTIQGSWAAIRNITARRYVSPWVYRFTALGAGALFLWYAWYLTANRLWVRHALNAAVVVASSLITLIAIEFVIRNFFPQQEFIPRLSIVYIPDDDIGFRLKPSVKTGLGFDTNRFGMRDYDHYTMRKPDGVYRILVMGDSFTFSITSMEDSFPKQMERMFAGGAAPIEVLNAGASGYGTDEEYFYFKKYGLRFEPDLAILGFYVGNDITDNHVHPARTAVDGVLVSLEAARTMEKEEVRWEKRKRALLNRSHLYRLLYSRNYSNVFRAVDRRNASIRRNMDTVTGGDCIHYSGGRVHVRPSKFEPITKESWEKTIEWLDRFHRLAERNGVPLAIVLIPDAIQFNNPEAVKIKRDLGDGYDWDYPQKALAALARQHGWNMFDALEAMRRKGGNGRLYYCGDTHFNEKGNRLLAESINNWLIEKRLVPPGTIMTAR